MSQSVLTNLVKTMQDKSSFGEFIRKMRQDREEPLRVVAAAVGIDSTLLSRLENGDRFPTEVQISKFAKFFKLPEGELKGRVIADKVTSEYDDDDAAQYPLSNAVGSRLGIEPEVGHASEVLFAMRRKPTRRRCARNVPRLLKAHQSPVRAE
jgi:transcriptional regulator with XRE-family HTH domain